MSPVESHSVINQTPRASQVRIPQTFTSRHSSWSSTRPKLLTPREMLKMCFLCVLFVVGLASTVAALFLLVENLTRTHETGPTVGTGTPISVETTFQTSFDRVPTEATTTELTTATVLTKTSIVPTETITTLTIASTVPTKSTTEPSSQNMSPTMDYYGSTNSSISSTSKIVGSTISRTNTTRRITSTSNSTNKDSTSQPILVPSSHYGIYSKVSSLSTRNHFHPKPKPFIHCFPNCRKRLFWRLYSFNLYLKLTKLTVIYPEIYWLKYDDVIAVLMYVRVIICCITTLMRQGKVEVKCLHVCLMLFLSVRTHNQYKQYSY